MAARASETGDRRRRVRGPKHAEHANGVRALAFERAHSQFEAMELTKQQHRNEHDQRRQEHERRDDRSVPLPPGEVDDDVDARHREDHDRECKPDRACKSDERHGTTTPASDSSSIRRADAIEHVDLARTAVDLQGRARWKAPHRIGHADHGWHADLPRQDRQVGQCAAGFGDQSDQVAKHRCELRFEVRCHENRVLDRLADWHVVHDHSNGTTPTSRQSRRFVPPSGR